MSVEVQIASFLDYISFKVRHRKTTNASGISRALVWAIIKRVFHSYAITPFLGSRLIKLPTIENKVKELTNRILGTHEFSQCIEAIDDTCNEMAELNENYSN